LSSFFFFFEETCNTEHTHTLQIKGAVFSLFKTNKLKKGTTLQQTS